MQTIEIPLSEYEKLREELSLLKDTELLARINKLIDLLYQDKYGLYLGEYTEDLTEHSVNNGWEDHDSGWDKV